MLGRKHLELKSAQEARGVLAGHHGSRVDGAAEAVDHGIVAAQSIAGVNPLQRLGVAPGGIFHLNLALGLMLVAAPSRKELKRGKARIIESKSEGTGLLCTLSYALLHFRQFYANVDAEIGGSHAMEKNKTDEMVHGQSQL